MEENEFLKLYNVQKTIEIEKPKDVESVLKKLDDKTVYAVYLPACVETMWWRDYIGAYRSDVFFKQGRIKGARYGQAIVIFNAKKRTRIKTSENLLLKYRAKSLNSLIKECLSYGYNLLDIARLINDNPEDLMAVYMRLKRASTPLKDKSKKTRAMLYEDDRENLSKVLYSFYKARKNHNVSEGIRKANSKNA